MAGRASRFRTVADGVEAASSMVLGRHLRCDVGPGRDGVRVRCRDGRGPREAAVGGFDERAGASTLRGRTIRHALHRGLCRVTRKLPMSPTITRAGRSRGGLTTKIHALTDPREAPVAVRLTAGQAGDNPQLVPLLDDYAAACKQQGASGRDFRLLGDKAYSHPSTRTELRS